MTQGSERGAISRSDDSFDRVGLLWRSIVVVAAVGIAAASAQGTAAALPRSTHLLLAGLRGLLVVVVGIVALVGGAWAIRGMLAGEGVPADGRLVPAHAPAVVRRVAERFERSRTATIGALAVIGMLVGFLGLQAPQPHAPEGNGPEVARSGQGSTDWLDDGFQFPSAIVGTGSGARAGRGGARSTGSSPAAGSEQQASAPTPTTVGSSPSSSPDQSSPSSGGNDGLGDHAPTTTTTVPLNTPTTIEQTCDTVGQTTGGTLDGATQTACDTVSGTVGQTTDAINGVLDGLLGSGSSTTTTAAPSSTTTTTLLPILPGL